MFPALGNVCVERKCFVRREKLGRGGEERRGLRFFKSAE